MGSIPHRPEWEISPEFRERIEWALLRGREGRPTRDGIAFRCPSGAHEDRHPSAQWHSARAVWRCYSCGAGGGALALARLLGINGPAGVSRGNARPAPRTVARTPRAAEPDERTAFALGLWRSALPATGTLAHLYLRARGIELEEPPRELRFAPRLSHGKSGKSWPAMVGRVVRSRDGVTLGVHRTFLALDGSGKAPVEPPKMMLGPARGGCVRLGEIVEGQPLLIAEGIETSLAASISSGLPAWAALSAGGMQALDLPAEVRDVIVCADADAVGRAAARDAGERWAREGRRVRIATPDVGDFADLLVLGGGAP